MNSVFFLIFHIFTDGCKARAALRRKITSNKERIKKIVCILEEDHGVIVTDDQLKQLIFPWHDDTEYGKSNFIFILPHEEIFMLSISIIFYLFLQFPYRKIMPSLMSGKLNSALKKKLYSAKEK